jgi:uncharacterized iron-regulated membrane protein
MRQGTYHHFWRWHFFAALFISPLLITFALSGIGYLFYTDVEKKAYADLFFGKSHNKPSLTIDQGIEQALKQYKGHSVSKVIVLKPPYNMRLTLTHKNGEQRYVFLDRNYAIVGSQEAKYTFSNIMREIHSSLFIGGTVVNYLVELAACWAIFLLFSGLYMTWRGRVLKKKPHPTKRQKHKKRHAFIGTLITIPMIIIIFTGLPWSAFMGHMIYQLAQEHPVIGFPTLKQQPPTSNLNEIPWATRENKPPSSREGVENPALNNRPISIHQLMQQIEKAHISKPYSIVLPLAKNDVYTVAKSSNTGITGLDVSPYDEVTIYFDQYTGKWISQVGYQDYGLLAKWFTWGIPLHEGHLFGWPNKLLNLAFVLLFLWVIFWGFRIWLARQKERLFAAPTKVSGHLSLGLILFLLILGLMMPLFGLSLILVAIIEFIIYLMTRTREKSI